VALNLYPIYKEVKPHPLLSEEETRELLAGTGRQKAGAAHHRIR
jgi:hypothetical protein